MSSTFCSPWMSLRICEAPLHTLLLFTFIKFNSQLLDDLLNISQPESFKEPLESISAPFCTEAQAWYFYQNVLIQHKYFRHFLCVVSSEIAARTKRHWIFVVEKRYVWINSCSVVIFYSFLPSLVADVSYCWPFDCWLLIFFMCETLPCWIAIDEIEHRTCGTINGELLPTNSSVNNALKFALGNPGYSIIQFPLSLKHERTGIVSDLTDVSLTSELITVFYPQASLSLDQTHLRPHFSTLHSVVLGLNCAYPLICALNGIY